MDNQHIDTIKQAYADWENLHTRIVELTSQKKDLIASLHESLGNTTLTKSALNKLFKLRYTESLNDLVDTCDEIEHTYHLVFKPHE